ncbi:MAG: AmmeMemoRadiSam system protein A [Dethiobacteria bacterium]
MSIVLGAIVPHPPLIIPDIGGSELDSVRKTVEAFKEAASRVASSGADTIVIITPHGPVHREAVAILADEYLQGNFGRFRASGIEFHIQNDIELVQEIRRVSRGVNLKTVLLEDTELDHGVMVPLYYLQEAGVKCRYVAITYSFSTYRNLFRFGEAVQEAVDNVGRKTVVIASSDLSHRLIPGAPAGYSPRGREFDDKLVGYLQKYEVEKILSMDEELIQAAGECGLRSIAILLGSLSGLEIRPEVLSYEGPFGVGYPIALFTPQGGGIGMRGKEGSIHVQIARRALENRVKGEKAPQLPDDLPEELQKPAAAFVSLKKRGTLRGCIGTIAPLKKSLAEEIAANALSAGLKDPRFPPVAPEELEELTYSVDVLSEPERIEDLSCLDPARYGVIVRSGNRTGLLLPALEGVTTVEEQLSIAREKAGIAADEPVEIFRFEVERFQ